MNSSKSDIYVVKDNSSILIVILIILFIGSFILLSSVYVMNYYLEQNLVKNVYDLERIKNILLIIVCVLIFISAILILVVGLKDNEEDYIKYQNYVIISKEELQNYKKEIKNLKDKKGKY